MLNPVPTCTHIKTNGEVCGSPAVSGSELCYHHSTVKTALSKARLNGRIGEGGFAPIPFIFPEDRASMQIDFFLLLQAFNEQRIDVQTYRTFLALLRAMATNLGRAGSLVKDSDQKGRDQTNSDQRSAGGVQKGRDQGSGPRDQENSDQRSAISVQKNRDQRREAKPERKPALSNTIWRDGIGRFEPSGKKEERTQSNSSGAAATPTR